MRRRARQRAPFCGRNGPGLAVIKDGDIQIGGGRIKKVQKRGFGYLLALDEDGRSGSTQASVRQNETHFINDGTRHTCVRVHINTRAHTRSPACKPTCLRTYLCAYAYTQVSTCARFSPFTFLHLPSPAFLPIEHSVTLQRSSASSNPENAPLLLPLVTTSPLS